MKSILVFCGAILISALPVFADSIPYSASAEDSRGAAPFIGAPATASLASRAASSPISFVDAAQLNGTPNPWDSASYQPSYVFSFDGATHPGSFDDLALVASSGAISEATFLADDHGDKHVVILDPSRHHDRDVHHHAVAIPEPGTLALAFLGLLAIGVLSFCRMSLRALAGRARNLPTAP